MNYANLLRIVPTLQAAALVGRNVKLAKKRKKKASDFLSAGTDTIIGSSLISAESAFLYG